MFQKCRVSKNLNLPSIRFMENGEHSVQSCPRVFGAIIRSRLLPQALEGRDRARFQLRFPQFAVIPGEEPGDKTTRKLASIGWQPLRISALGHFNGGNEGRLRSGDLHGRPISAMADGLSAAGASILEKESVDNNAGFGCSMNEQALTAIISVHGRISAMAADNKIP